MMQDELSPYAPIRLRNQAWWSFALKCAKNGDVVADGRIAQSFPNTVENSLVTPYLRAFHAEMGHLPEAPMMMGLYAAKVLQFRHWVPIAAQYELCGRQIFDFHDDLVELLANTDIGECTLEGWKRPYDAFYIRFGRQENIKVPFEDDYEYLDGAFVACTPVGDGPDDYRMKFGFTTAKKNGSGVMMPGYCIDFQPNEQKMLLSDAIDSALARKMAEFQDEEDSSPNTKALNAHRRHDLTESITLLRSGASLLVNSLFYLESIGNKTPDATPGRDTPPSRVSKWHQSNPVQRQKQRSGLTADGYAVVMLVGKEVAHESTVGPRSTASIRSHWRRGHWRWQRHGAGRVDRKRIWIKPVMVGVDNASDIESPGHVYIATGSDRIQ